MGRVNPPTQQELFEIARSPEAARAAVERWGMDALMDPYASEPCPDCPQQRGVGLGDLVKKATSAVGIKPCAPCEKRRRKLNRWRIGG